LVPGLSVGSLVDISGLEWECTPSHVVIEQSKLLYYGYKFLQAFAPVVP
jgi:hypothetical protein